MKAIKPTLKLLFCVDEFHILRGFDSDFMLREVIAYQHEI
jgi:hypothetical protein